MRARLGSTLIAAVVGITAFTAPAAAQTIDWATCGNAPTACSSTVTSCCYETAANLNIGQVSGDKAIIIPMDRCHQSIASATIFGNPGAGEPDAAGNGWCVDPSPANAEGMFFAYGLVYRMMQKGVPVWWIINPGKTATSVTGYAANLGSQRYVQSDIDLWITDNTANIPTSGNLADCTAPACTPPVSLLDDDLAVVSSYTYSKKQFPLRGSVFLIAGADTDADGTSDRVEFNTFWASYGNNSSPSGRTCAPSQDCHDFTDVTMYEINAGAEVKWKNYSTGANGPANTVPVAIKIDYQPPRIARVASGGAVSALWLQSANLNDVAATTCKLGVFSPAEAIVCDLTETDLVNNSLVAGQFGWAWFDGGANFTSCSRAIQMVKTFLTSVPGFTTSGNVLVNDTRLSEIEGCASHQLLGRSGAATAALAFGNVVNEAADQPFMIRYPTNLFTQYGDLPLQFAASSVAHWTTSTTNGYNGLFTGASNTLKRLITRERARVASTNEVCGDASSPKDGDVADAGELPHSKDVWPSNTASTCDIDPATAGTDGDREDMAAYGRFDNDKLNGIVFYIPGNSLNQAAVRGELRVVLNSIIATPSGKHQPATQTPKEVTRAAPVVPIINGVDAIVQGSYVYFDPPGTPSVVNNNTDAANFTFPYRIGHMRAVEAATPTTTIFDAGCNSVLHGLFPTSGFACPGGSGGIPATTTTYSGGCTFPKNSGNANCRTIFTNAEAGDRRGDTDYAYFNNEIADTSSSDALKIRNLIKTGTNLSDASVVTIVQRVIAGYPDGSGGRMAVLGGVDRSTTAVIQASDVAGTTRPLMAYFGAADGMLHAVCAEVSATKGCDVLGRELWAFLPRTMLPHLRTNTARIDGAPRVLDAYIDPDGSGTLGTQWRTILVFHTGMGDYSQAGRQPAIYAIDVTNPSAPKLMWEHSVTSAGTSSLGVGLTLSAGGATIAGVTKYLVWAQTNNLGSSGPGSVVTSIDLESGAQYQQRYFQFSPNPRVNTKDPVVYSGIPGGTVPVDLTGSAKVTDLVFTDIYGQLWLIDPDTLASRNGTGPLFKMSSDYFAIGAKPAIYSQGNAQYAVFATGGYTDPSNTTWPIACCASSNGSSCNSVPPTPTVCSQYNGSSQIFPQQMALAIKIDSSVTSALSPPGAACDTSPTPDPVAGSDLPVCSPTQFLFRRDLGRDERSSSQALIVGTDIFLATDSDNANRAAYGTNGASTGKLYTFGALGSQAASPTTIIAGVAGPAAGNEQTGTKNIYAGRFGSYGTGTTATSGTNVTATPSAGVSRKLWLRTE